MPELPEVETVRVQLWAKLKNQKITDVTILHQKSVAHDKNFKQKLKGKTLSKIDRIGKLLIFSFKEDANLFLLAHLKMTGQFFVTDRKGKISIRGGHQDQNTDQSGLPSRHTRVVIDFDNGAKLYFNDMRLFGYLKLANKTEVETAKSRFGPEPTSPNFDRNYFYTGLRKRSRSLKAVLLDQTFVAGLGNIYVDEALFRAKLLPTRLANTLNKKESDRLAKWSGQVMLDSIQNGGTTFQSFLDADGQKGDYFKKLKVFARQGKPCVTCGTSIIKTRVAGRGTHYCPQCQR